MKDEIAVSIRVILSGGNGAGVCVRTIGQPARTTATINILSGFMGFLSAGFFPSLTGKQNPASPLWTDQRASVLHD
jgi:hypothetical protein